MYVLVGQTRWRRMRWYNFKLKDFEWRTVPESDEEALALLDGRLEAVGLPLLQS